MEPTGLRPPTAVDLAEGFDAGVLAVVGPEPVEGPWVISPLIRSGEIPSLDAFIWQFWAGTDLRSVRIEMYSESFGPPREVFFQAILESWGHEGPATPTTLPITIDNEPLILHGESVGDGIALREVVAGIAVEVYLWDGWPLDEQLRFERRGGPDFDAMGLTWRNYWPPWADKQPPDIILARAGRPQQKD